MADLKQIQQQFHTCMPLFIALGDEVRLSIIEALSQAAIRQFSSFDDTLSISDSYPAHGGLNVNEITKNTNLSRPAVSHHLKILKNAGLVSMEKQGTSNYYYLTISRATRELMELGNGLQDIIT
ncbi:MAG: ArsR/SmtB family transcription factor [Lachnospiraceae bacterium]